MRIGTRRSALALAQAKLIATMLGGDCEIVPILTSGDADARSPAPDTDKSRWVVELEDALVGYRCSLTVQGVVVSTARPADHELVQVALGDVVDIAVGDHAPVRANDDPGAEAEDVRQHMRDEKEGRVPAGVPDQAEQDLGLTRAEPAGRLVEH